MNYEVAADRLRLDMGVIHGYLTRSSMPGTLDAHGLYAQYRFTPLFT